MTKPLPRPGAQMDEELKLELTVLPVRVVRVIERLGVKTIEELQQITDCELLRQPNFHRRSLAAIRSIAPYRERHT
jgi:DNA-directed RNA polymerase alpha subunit